MKIDRRHLALLALGLLAAAPAFALSAEEEAVAKRVEAFRTAQIAQDAKALDELAAPELSYSHSDGRVEDKATFIKNATSGRSKSLSLQYKDPTIRVVGDVAIVRFHWSSRSYYILRAWYQREHRIAKALARLVVQRLYRLCKGAARIGAEFQHLAARGLDGLARGEFLFHRQFALCQHGFARCRAHAIL